MSEAGHPLELSAADSAWLAAFVAQQGGIAGSVHRRRGELLVATAFLGIPPAVQAVTTHIPAGKGMAGLAWVRRAPVTTCNLATDESGNVRPGARAVGARAATALPVLDAAGEVRAVVGLAFAGEELPATDALLAAAAELSQRD